MVVELLPYNWEWKGVSRIYKNITSSMGDINHFAWRAKHPKWAVYPSPHEARYAEWTAEECVGRCVKAECCRSTDAGAEAYNKQKRADRKLMCSLRSSSGIADFQSCALQALSAHTCLRPEKLALLLLQALACLTKLSLECCSDCLDVHARAAMRVDVATVQELIVESLPGRSRRARLCLLHAQIMGYSRMVLYLKK